VDIGDVDVASLPAANLGQKAMAASLSVTPASDVTDATYIGDIKFGEALPAGTNAIGKLAANSGVDIGDVDVTSLPAANLGQKAMAASLSVTPASDVTDGTYLGDIKFGEALPAGTAAIGKLAANSGVDIGDVDVTSQPADTFVAEDGALGKGVLLQGDDGTDRHNVAVDTSGRLQVDIAEQSDATALAVDATGSGDVPITLDGETVELAASTAAIGKLAANTGVDIGDVDVTSLPGAIQGPGNPTVDSFSSAVVNLAASTDNQVLVAAPGADKQLWVYGLFMMADTAHGTVTLQDEDDTAYSGTMAVSDEGGWVLPMSGNFAMPWVKVATNKALEADVGACTVDGIICYAIVDVS